MQNPFSTATTSLLQRNVAAMANRWRQTFRTDVLTAEQTGRYRLWLYVREAKYAKNHFQQNRYSVFEGHVMRKESISTKILRPYGNSEVV